MNTKMNMNMNKQSGLVGIIIIIIVALLLGVGIIAARDKGFFKDAPAESEPIVEEVATTTPQREDITFKVYFIDTENPEYETECDVTKEVTRTVAYTEKTADAALKALFAGPTAAEKDAGLISTFESSQNTASGTKSLGDYYLGVSIANESAQVNFEREALEYLNSPACMQAGVKAPIDETLKQFPTVKEVEYAIDGEVYTEWDA